MATLIRNGLVVTAEGRKKEDILIENGKISRLGEDLSKSTGVEEVIDASSLMVLPGLIDAHTHYHLVSRGTVTADSFPQGSRLAAFGGVTTVVDFADDNHRSLPGSLQERLDEMKGMAIDHALHQGVYQYRETLPEEMRELREKGASAIKIFTTYRNVGYLVDDREELKEIFSLAHREGLLVTVHCEDDKVITEINDNWQGGYAPSDHALMRPAEAEAEGIRYVGEIALELDMPVYIVHVSSLEGLETVRDLRRRGGKVYMETTPHYLFLDKSKLEGEKGPLFVMTPPLRTRDDNKALQEALLKGEVQVVATDHCSFTYEQKLQSHDCRTIFPGIPGTEELLPLLHTFARDNGMAMEKVVDLISTSPARLFGLYPRKGTVLEGSDADLVLFDPEEEWVLENDSVHSASHYTPYEGFRVKGKVKRTLLRGKTIVNGSEYYGREGDGEFLPATR